MLMTDYAKNISDVELYEGLNEAELIVAGQNELAGDSILRKFAKWII